ncbi:MAG TPA: permease prefix domain 2-containing transporter [Acidobacteriaceae bacterium]
MTPQPFALQPPRLAVWLVDLFTLPDDAEQIMGDLLEEFSQLASKSGVVFAQRWYWRQAVKTIAYLVPTAFNVAPWSTTAGVVGGFLTRRLLGRLVEPAIFAVLERYHVYQYHFKIYMFFASTGIDIGHLITFLFVGCVVALLAKRREMVPAIGLGLIFAAMAVVGSLAVVARTGDYTSLWRLTWYFADSFAILIGGAIVRTRRSAATTLPSDA